MPASAPTPPDASHEHEHEHDRLAELESAATGLAALLARTVAELAAADAHDEAIAELRAARRVLLFTKEASFTPLGRAWRLGVLMLDRIGTLYATGKVTRATEPGRVTNQSSSQEERRAIRKAAFEGPFVRGEVVNYDLAVIGLDAASLGSAAEPLSVRDGTVLVRWTGAVGDAGLAPLDRYLADRVALLTGDAAG